ncbi:MAG: hypothetical protein AAGN82_21960 [Myxococcota bacterium]
MLTRLLGLALAMAVAGWAAFTLYERGVAAAPTNERTPPSNLGAGSELLAAGRYDEAAAHFRTRIETGDEEANFGLAWVEVARAHDAWRTATIAGSDDARALEAFDAAVDAARLQIAAARRIGPELDAPLMESERHLNTLLVVALGQAGATERASGALHARLEGTSAEKPLAAWLAGRGSAPSSSAASAPSTQPSTAPSAAPKEAPSPRRPAPHAPDEHFEFEDEPAIPVPTPGELQLPAPTPAE